MNKKLLLFEPVASGLIYPLTDNERRSGLPARVDAPWGNCTRAKIPGGWLLNISNSPTFVPDPNHEWDGGSLP